MHWIEQLLHVSPDGGNGIFEAAIYAVASVPILLAVASSQRVRRRRRWRRDRQLLRDRHRREMA